MKTETIPPLTNIWLPKSNKVLSISFFSIVMVLVILNIFTPLRLNNDAIRYLKILELIKNGPSHNADAAHDILPHGYSWFLYLLDSLSLLSPVSITLINIGSVLASSYLLAKILKINNRLLYFTLVMISFVNIKEFTLGVSDQFFTLLFITAIYLWTEFFKKRPYYIIPALIITVIAIYIRTAGISLLLGIIFYTIYLNKTRLLKSKLSIASIIILAIASIAVFVYYLSLFKKKVDYVRQLKPELLFTDPSSIIKRLAIHFKELGEVFINMPYSKLSTIIHLKNFNIAESLLVITGLLSLYIFYKVVINLKLYKSLVFWIFLSYLLMIFLWPYYDTRFLIPVVPVLIFLLFYYLFVIVKKGYLKFAVLTIYLTLGFFSLAYSDALSLSKPFFLNHYGFSPSLTDKYRIHFKNELIAPSNKPVYDIKKDDMLFLLEKYDH